MNGCNNKEVWFSGTAVLVQGTVGQLFSSSCGR